MKKFEGYMKGVDLGGWLSQGSYEKEHLDSFIHEDDIEKLAGWGIDHVRLPIDYNVLQDEEGSFIPSGFGYIDNAIEWCKKNGLHIVLDLHKTQGFIFDDEEYIGFFKDEVLQERFYRLWEEFARRYGKMTDTLTFELLNEVTDPEFSPTWNKIIRTVIGRIRAIAPEVKILVGSYWNNSIDAIKDLDDPYDENVIYNFHCYEPLIFTHQAAGWVKQMYKDYRIAYPGDVKQYLKDSKDLQMDYMDHSEIAGEGYSAEYFVKRFENAVKLCEEKGTTLYCGEYGVIDYASPEDTLQWFKDIHEAFEHFGIGRAAWSYKQMNFGLSDERLDCVREELIKYL
ncbi:MAG: cellulase family glycosylhydrolase [Ruminococcus sp.]|nr:cellulase family glycosylhydrolase [Ruminococcus sp.]